MRVYFHTLGCKVNAVESDSMAAMLHQHGYASADAPEDADVIVVNSCTVTASGDSRMRTALRKLRASAPDAVIVLTGCYVQAFPEEAAQLPEADILLGTKERALLPSLLERYFEHPEHLSSVGAYRRGDAFEELPQGSDRAHTRAFLKIQDGCDRFCTYCIIPYARGRCRSRSAESVRQEAENLRTQGFLEIVLCGINLACWGMEFGMDLADAAQICADAGFPRVRFSSLEPDGLTETVLDKLAANPALCPHFHISVQSGCDRTLAAMHRHYNCAEYGALLTAIRQRFPDAAITTDIMAGFPDETEEDFAQTLAFVEEMQFAQMHVFRYSPRAGTPAADYPHQIPEDIKKARADALSASGRGLQEGFLRACIGRTLSVLFERERGRGFHQGHAENYAAVLVPDTDGSDWRGTIRNVSITGLDGNRLIGELADRFNL